ncbi:tetratricopeptide repeat protein [Aspergillus alliaceus]|uniref:tetratricopeptide repeat protein n=1 Tax=Petromyces alliaceus TaxID=209559 RepID=UPI0012A3BC4D|nr:uncharacterized protein BDW43DRAFT_292763 [Aspergillus alliaceus]KAB8227892.1 hypothetical protein BDW43DRAFT_292763 [Aspergillus alliaceus]
MHNLALTWKLLGKVQDALALMEKCVGLRRTLLGPNHPYAISSSNVLREWERELNSLSKKPTQQTSAATSPALPIHNNPPNQIKSDSKPVTGGKRWELKRVSGENDLR